MKLVYTLTAVTVLGSAAFIGGIYASNIKTDSQQALDACAREHNVFACKWVAVPAKEPRVVYEKAELLPPPAGM
jgi:hypothetical protein